MSHNSARIFSVTVVAIVLAGLAVVALRAQGWQPSVPTEALQNPPPVRFKSYDDLPAGDMKQKATTACTECHEARIILQQRLSKAAWTKEVDKMIKWGALVDTQDHDLLIDYLSTNFSPDKPPYEAPRSAAEKYAAGKTPK